MTKDQLIQFMAPFSNDTEVLVRDAETWGLWTVKAIAMSDGDGKQVIVIASEGIKIRPL